MSMGKGSEESRVRSSVNVTARASTHRTKWYEYLRHGDNDNEAFYDHKATSDSDLRSHGR